MDTYKIETYFCEVYSAYDDDIGGTADFVGLSDDGKTLIMGDYKSGDGVMVYAEGNKQLLFYAMCGRIDRLREYFKDVEKLVLAIVQPSERRESTLDVWETDIATLDAFEDVYIPAVEAADRGDTEPKSGSHCAFCPAEPTCPARTGLIKEVERLPADSLIKEQVSEALQIAEGLESWIASVRKFARDQMERGVEIDGFKLVPKRAQRVWNDADAVEALIKRSKKLKIGETHSHKLLSPAQLEKLCKSKGMPFDGFKEHVSAVSSGTTLAHASDPRPNAIPTEAARIVAERFA